MKNIALWRDLVDFNYTHKTYENAYNRTMKLSQNYFEPNQLRGIGYDKIYVISPLKG